MGVKRVLSGSPHLLGEDVVGHIHHAVLMVTEAFYFGHHRGLDAGVDHLISFLVDEDPAAGQRTNTKDLAAGEEFSQRSGEEESCFWTRLTCETTSFRYLFFLKYG